MNFNGHVIGGVTVASVSTYLCYTHHLLPNDIPTALATFTAGVICSLYPDMDIKSKSSRILSVIFWGPAIYWFATNNIVPAILMALIATIPNFLPHRGFTHSIACATVVSASLMYIAHVYNPCIFAILLLCYYTHLVLDGIPTKLT